MEMVSIGELFEVEEVYGLFQIGAFKRFEIRVEILRQNSAKF